MSGIGDTGGAERRRHVRVRISVLASLEAPPRAPLACEVFNMSIGGALLGCEQSIRLGQKVVLHLQEFGPVEAHVARVTSTVIALAFEGHDEAALGEFLRRHSGQVLEATAEASDSAG